jgi:putative DNA-invertase from lambdoid prophage Rac
MAIVVYVLEESGDISTHDRDLFDIDAAGYVVDMSMVFVERGSCTVSALSRPAFQRALRRLHAGDTLITTKLWCLGNSVADANSTIGLLERRGIVMLCLAFGKFDLCSEEGRPYVEVLRLAEELERVMRRIRAHEAANVAKARGIAQGRPSSLSEAQQRQAMDSLDAGHTVTQIARMLSTSRQTIMRLRHAHSRQTQESDGHTDSAAKDERGPIAANGSD